MNSKRKPYKTYTKELKLEAVFEHGENIGFANEYTGAVDHLTSVISALASLL